MNRNKLKAYAPQARRDFIQAVKDRAAHFGLTDKTIEPMIERGDVVMIAGDAFPKAVGEKRKKLEARIKKLGFDQTMEAMAYTWFNRLVAIRFMELHGYLEHGYRVLSHPEGHAQPDFLEHAQHVDLPGLNPQKVIELKLDGTKAEELYRLLLVAQCNALHKALPFLFESIDDETELLLPDYLLHSDSLIRKLVNEIDEEDWQAVEIIGWLYESYISEKHTAVIGTVVANEDIPAATQLFTPNWIVKYLVQNTLGRQWLATYPQSPLRQQMEYYIEPAEQTLEVQEQLKAITPTSLNPEELTLLDSACGSAHILVEAYDLFKAIYQERGYRAKDIPALILQKNLFGLEIDDRAAQLAAFALMMKARADDRRIFESDVKPNVLAFVESKGMNAADITHALNSPILQEPERPKEELFDEIEEEKAGLFSKKSMGVKNHVSQADVAALLELFEEAKTFGSLIQIPTYLVEKLPEIEQRLKEILKHGDLIHASARVIEPLLRQSQMLATTYECVVANPPYLNRKGMTPLTKAYLKTHYPHGDDDLFAAFILRSPSFGKMNSSIGIVTPFTWMYLSSFEQLRRRLLAETTLEALVELETNAFEPAMVTVCAFVLRRPCISAFVGGFVRLSEFKGAQNQAPRTIHAIKNRDCGWFYAASSDGFSDVPGCPIAYWSSEEMLAAFRIGIPLSKLADVQPGLQTSDNNRFVRFWHEVPLNRIGFDCNTNEEAVATGRKWFPYNKGGDYRLWYGNNWNVVNWAENGREIKEYVTGKYPYLKGNIDYVVKDRGRYFRPSITWSKISSAYFGVRKSDSGFLFDVAGSSAFPAPECFNLLLGFLCSKTAATLINVLNPTLNKQTGNVADLPFLQQTVEQIRGPVEEIVKEAIQLTKEDWDRFEISWDFRGHPLCATSSSLVEESVLLCDSVSSAAHKRLRELEVRNNCLWATAYSVSDVVDSDVPEDMVSIKRVSREEDIKRLLSYAIGCMMGRYSLDEPGLIYSQSGNQEFDLSKYLKLPADEDGIIPLTEFDWSADDVANRFIKFLSTAWPAEHLEVNLQFVAESLGHKKGEAPPETIRRYLSNEFFKHHLSMYRKRPIYWLFSSGKQRGFQAVVYLHRYNEGTLSRMRTEYVIPLLGKMTARISHLTDDIAAVSSSQHKKRLETEKATVTKQLAEVQTFDEKLRHYADQRITIDLDDGVKVNYGKFGHLLAEVKAVTGGSADE